jgi:heptosyltransferase I
VKILILKPSSLGDVVQALPVLRLIKRHFAESEVYWWIDTRFAPLIEHDPDLAGVLHFERRGWADPSSWLRFWRTLQWVRRQRFDWVLDLQSLARSALFAWLANGKVTIGLDTPREAARGFYDYVVRRPSFHTHAVDWYLQVLPCLNVPNDRPFRWLPEQPSVAAAVRHKWPVGTSRWVVLQPGARWLNKRWPANAYADLARRFLQSDPDVRLAIMGGAEDRQLGELILREAPRRCLDLTGQVSLPEMVEWLRLSTLMVTNDTGPMHVAAALDIPVLPLFGPTEPRRTGPYGQLGNALQLDLPCVPCLKPRCRYFRPLECLRALSPEAVFTAASRQLAQARPPKSASPYSASVACTCHHSPSC